MAVAFEQSPPKRSHPVEHTAVITLPLRPAAASLQQYPSVENTELRLHSPVRHSAPEFNTLQERPFQPVYFFVQAMSVACRRNSVVGSHDVRQTIAPNPTESSVPGGYLYPRIDPDLHALHSPLPKLHAVQFE